MSGTSPKSRRRLAALTTASVISFSLTLLGGSLAVLFGVVPLKSLNVGERLDVGALLFVMPVLALVLAVVFEAARIALKAQELPEPRRRQTVQWSPGRREG